MPPHPNHPDWPEDFPNDDDSPPELRSPVGTDRDGATLRIDSVVEVEDVGVARVISCSGDVLTVAFAGHIVSDEIDRARARRVQE